MLFADQGR